MYNIYLNKEDHIVIMNNAKRNLVLLKEEPTLDDALAYIESIGGWHAKKLMETRRTA